MKKVITTILVVAVSCANTFSIFVPTALAATSPWTQTDWVGGSGQTSWADSTKYSSASSITTTTAGQASLTSTDKASNGTFETDLTGWTTAGTPWWLAGGVSAANAIVAYQPIGAANLAGSYINLANAGTHNAAPGVAPTFDASTGWTFNGTQYLTTTITPNDSPSIIIRYSNSLAFGGPILGAEFGYHRIVPSGFVE